MEHNHSLQARQTALMKGRLPAHVAIIMDGNGRWAKSRGLARIEGHRAGVDTVRRVVEAAKDLGIGYITLYTFSSENWTRPPGEVLGLMDLLSETIEHEIPDLNHNRIRVRTIGDLSILPRKSREALEKGIRETTENDAMTLVIAINYGGRDEIVRAVRSIAGRVKDGSLDPAKITPEMIGGALDTAGMPDPDLLIRTSGEYRLSNFLLWQIAYTELWVTGVLWPDFSREDFFEALESYAGRERRFGKTSQQITGVAKKVVRFFTGGGQG